MHGKGRVFKASLGKRFAIWLARCTQEEQEQLWQGWRDFTLPLAQIARDYADAMPERAAILLKANAVLVDYCERLDHPLLD